MTTAHFTETLSREVAEHRQTDFNIHPMFLNRWSPRAYSNEPVPDDILMRAFEAARWAPSAANEQPWRFIVARSADERARFLSFIHPRNVEWCQNAPVLALLVSNSVTSRGTAYAAHSFDAGAAWNSLALQATLLGLHTHAMGGFDADKAREALNIPAEFQPHIVISLGYLGDKDQLPEDFQARELPSGRRPLSQTLYEGTFGNPVLD